MNIRIFGRYEIHPQGVSSTAVWQDLGFGLNLKLVLYLDDLANPNNGLNLVPNPLITRTLGASQKKSQDEKN